jgi:4-amino-4-deoxy-L-arabinose transferase-like glycosyltransferase
MWGRYQGRDVSPFQRLASPRIRSLVLLGAAVVLLTGLGRTDLWLPDEPRYVQIAEEMRSWRHGAAGLVLLHLNGEPYTQKPPVYFWLAALAGAPFGRVSELAARLPSALAALGLVALTMRLGGRLLGPAAGVLGALLLLGLFDFSDNARRAGLDLPLAFLEAAALAAFWTGQRATAPPRRNVLVLHACLGLALLTKGPPGWLVPVLVMAVHLAGERRARDLGAWLRPWGLAVSLGPILAWLAACAAVAPPGWLHVAVVENVFGRVLGGVAHDRPIWFFARGLPQDLLPWSLLLPVVALAGGSILRREPDLERRRAWRLLLAWALVTLAFFSLSSGKRERYLIPSYPAWALLFADSLRWWVARAGGVPRLVAVTLAALAAAALVAAPVLVLADPLGDPFTSRALAASLIAVLLAGAVAWRRVAAPARDDGSELAVAAAAVGAIAFVFQLVVPPALDERGYSLRPLAESAAALAAPGSAIGVFRDEAAAGGIAYYGRRDVVQLADSGQVRRFLETRGDVVVAPASRLEELRAVPELELRLRFDDDDRDRDATDYVVARREPTS